MKWVLIDDESYKGLGGSDSEHQIQTYAFMIDGIGCIVLVKTMTSSSTTFVTGTKIVDNKLVIMDGYRYMPEDVWPHPTV